MSDRSNVVAIPRDVALQICAEIQKENRRKWASLAALQCRFCLKFSKGDPEKMCIANVPDYSGCNLVNKRYNEKFSRKDIKDT